MQWLKQLFSRHRRYDDLSVSIQEHLDEKIDELVAEGMSREQATQAARREFGNVTRLRERSREEWQWPALESLWADVKFALRQLARSPGFTISALLILGLGIGANTAVFSIINAVMFRPLPYFHPERLVSIQSKITIGVPSPEIVSYPDFFDWRSRNTVFERMVAYHEDEFTLSGQSEAEHLDGEVVSWDLFPLLGVKPVLGRSFLRTEESRGTHVVVLSYDLWKQRFHADPSLIGHSVTIDKLPYTVVGVAPKSFQFPVQNPGVALWTTIAHDASPIGDNPPLTTERNVHTLDDVIARLKSGITLQAAQAQIDGLVAALAKQYPETDGRLAGVYIKTELDRVVGDMRHPLYILLGAVGLVLLIACANIASLLLLRTTERERELAMRAALGASRARVIRQLLTENLLLAALGSLTGLLLCLLCNRLLIKMASDSIPRIAQAGIDAQVFAFLALSAIFTAAIFSLPAAMQIATMDFTASLKTGTSKNVFKRDRLRNSMVIGQIAISLMLLSGAALLISSLMHLENQDIGVRPDHLLTFSAGLPEEQSSGDKIAAFYRQLLEKLDSTPGILSAAAGPLPLTGDQISMAFDIPERSASASNRPRSDMAFVTPGYFRTAGTPLLQGRDFTRSDVANSPPVFIVNKAFADEFFPGENPIGKRIRGGPSLHEIVGVVGNARQSALSSDAQPIGYLPFYQLPLAPVSVVIHTSLPPHNLESTVRAVVSSLDPQVPVYEVRTMRELLSAQISDPRLHGILLSIFAGLALALTVVGLYGSIAYSVSRRSRDIGIRMALGATRSTVSFMVLWQALGLVVLGIVVGFIGTLFGTTLLRNMLFGITAGDPWPFLMACSLMAIAGGIAAYIPARRAASIDPMQALRNE